jgi:hypothetical protein
MTEVVDFVNAAVGVFVASVLLWLYFFSDKLKIRRRVVSELIMGALCVGLSVAFIILFFDRKDIPLVTWGVFIYAYSITLFIVISEAMLWKGAKYLTKKRGSKWVKELDYIYLSLGAVGIFGSLSRVEGLAGRTTKFDILGPIVLATALVLRFIKTRAEIAGWNKSNSS